MDYPGIAVEKATNFLKQLEVFTKQYHPGGEVEAYHQAGSLRNYRIKFTLCDGDESLGFSVKIVLDDDGTLAENPKAKSWAQRDYYGR
jgi:hypothetical protein